MLPPASEKAAAISDVLMIPVKSGDDSSGETACFAYLAPCRLLGPLRTFGPSRFSPDLRAFLLVGKATWLQWLENRTEIGADCKAGILRLIWLRQLPTAMRRDGGTGRHSDLENAF